MNKNFKSFLHYFVSDLFIKGFLFISLPLLSRIMSPEEYGKLSLVNSSIMILFVFVSFNLQNAISNRVMKGGVNIGSYIYSNLVFLIPMQLFIIALSYFYASKLSSILSVSVSDIQWVLVISSLLSIFYIYTAYLQATQQSKIFSILTVTNKLIEMALIFIFALLLVENQYLSKIYAQIIVVIISLVIIAPRFKRILVMKFNFSYIKDSMIFSLPLIPHVVSNGLLSQADRFIITKQLGFSEAGIYSFSYNLGMAIIVVIMAWNGSWQPRLFDYLNKRNYDKIKEISMSVAGIVAMISFMYILFSKEIVLLMADSKYHKAIEIVPIIIVGNSLIFVYQVYSNFTLFERKTFYISIATAIALFCNIILNFKLIPHFGINGAAWATVISYVILCLVHYIIAKCKCSYMPINMSILFVFLSFVMSGYIVANVINTHFDFIETLVIKLMISLSMLLILYCYKHKIRIS